MEDRRLHPRTSIRSRVLLKNENFAHAADVLDISAGGVRVSWANQSAREGATLQITLGVTHNHFCSYDAEVVRVHDQEVSLRFQSALPEEILEAAIRLATQAEPSA